MQWFHIVYPVVFGVVYTKVVFKGFREVHVSSHITLRLALLGFVVTFVCFTVFFLRHPYPYL